LTVSLVGRAGGDEGAALDKRPPYWLDNAWRAVDSGRARGSERAPTRARLGREPESQNCATAARRLSIKSSAVQDLPISRSSSQPSSSWG